MNKNLVFLFAAVLLSFTFSCSRNARWELKGDIKGADDASVLLETSFNGRWFAVDSTRTDRSGKFSFEQPAVKHPTVFRLSFNGEKAYFPVDSADKLVFTADASDFSRNYDIKGTLSAENMIEVNKLISAAGQSAPYDPALKRKLGEIILTDPSGITAYYIINSTTSAGIPIFSSSDKKDLRIIGAVANAYSEKRPDDPRTQYIKSVYLGSKREERLASNVVADTLVAREISYPEILLIDDKGIEQSLNTTVENGPVLVNFTVYGAEFSPALNMELGRIYEQYSPRGLQIYQVGFDSDEFLWRQTARNLPWITVFNSPKNGADYIIKYNVDRLPATFLINGNGELVERITEPADIEASVRKLL